MNLDGETEREWMNEDEISSMMNAGQGPNTRGETRAEYLEGFVTRLAENSEKGRSKFLTEVGHVNQLIALVYDYVATDCRAALKIAAKIAP